MGSRRRTDLILVLAMLLPGLAQAGNIVYCCDVAGRPVCGDVLPLACYGRAYREITPQGTLRREVQAPLTAEDLARREAELSRRREADEKLLKQRRLDQALLDTYRNLVELDARRARALSEIDHALNGLRERESELLARKLRLTREFEALHEVPARHALGENLRMLERELVMQRSLIDARLREREQVRQYYENDRRRYIELTAPEVQSLPPR